jgi:DNA-binding NarL/FixJ family response regulator
MPGASGEFLFYTGGTKLEKTGWPIDQNKQMRILLADEQTRVRSALQVLLQQESGVNIVGEAREAKELLAQLRATQPDLVLLDWELPDLATVGSLPALQTACPSLRVIVLSGRPEARLAALAAGADDFVSKVDPPTQLLLAIHAVDKRIGGVDRLITQSAE